LKKIKPIQLNEDKKVDLHVKYEEIYRDSDVWLYTKSHGVHSAILGQIKDYLLSKKVLDVGCGAGRLTIMCAHFAKEATGFDFSESAIKLARLCASCTKTNNVEFFVSDINEFCEQASRKYDVITMAGVLEHIQEPVTTLRAVAELLDKDGILVVSCPNFINFRGFSYMTLLTLFGLPMSLADLQQIDVKDIRAWAKNVGLKLEKTLGAIYKFGWAEKASKDMIKRVPLAIKDKNLGIEVDFEAYNTWLDRIVEFNEEYLNWLKQQGILKLIERSVKINVERDENIDSVLWEKVKQYLDEDIKSDPYYSDTPPFCYMGGEGIYLLKNKRT
jgi:2-polyprenyl-6-hydroxyphenyl methylase/3-demethylubiquinone-9 3-methyltransferase